MSDDEIYNAAIRAYTTDYTDFYSDDDWRGWLNTQTDDVLVRLYTGLSRAEENTLVVYNSAALKAAGTYGGRIVIRGQSRIDEYYAWDDHCNNVCILDDVTEVLRDRFSSRHALRSRRCLATTQEVETNI